MEKEIWKIGNQFQNGHQESNVWMMQPHWKENAREISLSFSPLSFLSCSLTELGWRNKGAKWKPKQDSKEPDNGTASRKDWQSTRVRWKTDRVNLWMFLKNGKETMWSVRKGEEWLVVVSSKSNEGGTWRRWEEQQEERAKVKMNHTKITFLP